jgi:predicted transcriptional regulator
MSWRYGWLRKKVRVMGCTQLILALHVEESETSESERMDVVDEEIVMQMPITVDRLYNLVVCEECGIGIPFEWVKTHLKNHHGVRKTEEEVRRKLNVDRDPMTVQEAYPLLEWEIARCFPSYVWRPALCRRVA